MSSYSRVAPADEALLERLASVYEPQLAAYGACAASFFPGCRLRLSIYSTVAGAGLEIPSNF